MNIQTFIKPNDMDRILIDTILFYIDTILFI